MAQRQVQEGQEADGQSNRARHQGPRPEQGPRSSQKDVQRGGWQQQDDGRVMRHPQAQQQAHRPRAQPVFGRIGPAQERQEQAGHDERVQGVDLGHQRQTPEGRAGGEEP